MPRAMKAEAPLPHSPDCTFIDIHAHRILMRLDDSCDHGWRVELFPMLDAEKVDGLWKFSGFGESLGTFKNVGLAVAAAKKRNPPAKVEIEQE
jgi:hypothetical protein